MNIHLSASCDKAIFYFDCIHAINPGKKNSARQFQPLKPNIIASVQFFKTIMQLFLKNYLHARNQSIYYILWTNQLNSFGEF
jgi:hypothetical protein